MKNSRLYIDIETFSSVDIKSCGAYKYMQSDDFEIILISYAFDNGPIKILEGEKMDSTEFYAALTDPDIEKHAHNAVFERQAFKAIGYDIPAEQWYCSAVKSSYCGLPLGLAGVSRALQLEEKGKLKTGNALIKYFCIPCKPSKTNEGRTRNFAEHNPEKWQEFKEYCINDVVAAREIVVQLDRYQIPDTERENYILDAKINDKGVSLDLDLAQKAVDISEFKSLEFKKQMKDLTGLDNPNSPAQLKAWLTSELGREITSLTKDSVLELIAETNSEKVFTVLNLRLKAAKTSVKKYAAMVNCADENNIARGLFQFYGAGRTGRWAGRLIQLQNMPRHTLSDLKGARDMLKMGDVELADICYDNVPDILSQLTRTALVPSKGNMFIVADFSAIEARVISWLAGEQWRLDVFNGDGKIYETSAAMMFNIPIEDITKGSDLRAKGKIAELALGYGGSLGALTKMGGDKMGLSDKEMQTLVNRWRASNPQIVRLWKSLNMYAIWAVKNQGKKVVNKNFAGGLSFYCDGLTLAIGLPSGRSLYYYQPNIGLNRFDSACLEYMGTNSLTKQWEKVDTYGGKLAENITQAIARDLLAEAMLRLDKKGFDIRMHVHDEAVAETSVAASKKDLKIMCDVMGENVSWANGLPLEAEGYVSEFYKK